MIELNARGIVFLGFRASPATCVCGRGSSETGTESDDRGDSGWIASSCLAERDTSAMRDLAMRDLSPSLTMEMYSGPAMMKAAPMTHWTKPWKRPRLPVWTNSRIAPGSFQYLVARQAGEGVGFRKVIPMDLRGQQVWKLYGKRTRETDPTRPCAKESCSSVLPTLT